MSFLEQRLPDDQSYGASGGPSFSTDIVATASGHEHRNANWSQARGAYDIGYTRNQTQLDALIAFFRACHGRAYGFRYKDHTDYRVLLADGRIGSAVGDGTPGPHQLRKRYTSGSSTTDRDIRKPAGAPAIYRGGVLQTITTHYTLNTTTGMVTWVGSAPTPGESLTWSGEFDVPVRFDADEIRATMLESGAANRMYTVASLGLVEIKV
jgi:uncharacterized protein (TIGR02217 family)